MADVLKLPPVMDRLLHATIDGCDSLKRHLIFSLWCMFQFYELIWHLALTLYGMLRQFKILLDKTLSVLDETLFREDTLRLHTFV